MPNRNIYVRDNDVELFERASELADEQDESLSAAIAQGLRRWITQREAEADDYEEVTLEPGSWTVGGLKGAPTQGQPVKFVGRQLASYCDGGIDDNRETTWTIYLTRAGKIIIETHYNTRWEGETGSRRVDVYDVLEQVPVMDGGRAWDETDTAIPETVIIQAQEALGEETAQWID